MFPYWEYSNDLGGEEYVFLDPTKIFIHSFQHTVSFS